MMPFCCFSSRHSAKSRPSATSNQQPSPLTPLPAAVLGPHSSSPVPLASSPVALRPISTASMRLVDNISTMFISSPLELDLLVDEDSESGEEFEPATASKNSSTLQLVKTHISRHLSQGSTIRRNDRPTLGGSDEEIARRAELKRLMHIRIREELSREEGHAARSETSSRNPASRYAADELPGGGPRDNLEFAVAEVEITTNADEQDTSSRGPTPDTYCIPMDDDGQDRRLSLPVYCQSGMSPRQPVVHAIAKQRKSLPYIPPSPDLLPQGPPSNQDATSVRSWQLSYSASQLNELLGYAEEASSQEMSGVKDTPLNSTGPKHGIPMSSTVASLAASPASPAPPASPARPAVASQQTQSVVDESPIHTWLRTQEFRRDGSQPQTARLRGMDTLQQVTLRDFSNPDTAPYLSVGDSGSLRVNGPHRDDATVPQSPYSETTPLALESPLDKGATANDMPSGLVTGSSSRYPSTVDFTSQSPRASAVHVPEAGRKSILGMRLPSFKSSANPKLKNSPYRTEFVSGWTFGTGSGNISAASSYQRREAELQTIEKRFGQSHLRNGPSIPVVSKFREEFDDLESQAPKRKPSLFARLNLAVPKRARLASKILESAYPEDEGGPPISPKDLTAANQGDGLELPTGGASYRNGCHPVGSSAALVLDEREDETAEMWQRAFRQEAQRRNTEAQRPADFHIRSLSSGSDAPSRLPRQSTRSPRYSLNITPPRGQGHIPVRTSCRCSPSLLEASPSGLRKYVGLSGMAAAYGMRLAHEQASDRPEASPVRPESSASSGKDVNSIPEAWARFPSHTRAERNGAAGQSDRVTSHDFAVKSSTDEGSAGWSTDRTGPQRPPKLPSRTVSGKIGNAVMSGLSKFMPSKTPAERDSRRSARSQESPQTEYPELDLNPGAGGYEEVRAMEKDIDYLRGEEPRAASSPLLSAAGGESRFVSRLSLMLRGETDNSENDSTSASAPLAFDAHPRTQAKRSTTTTASDRFVTPNSGMSQSRESLSFRSYPYTSRPQSRAQTIGGVAETTDRDAASLKSEATVIFKRVRSTTPPDLDRSGPSRSSRAGSSKFNTWNGRARSTQPGPTRGRLFERDDGVAEIVRVEKAKPLAVRVRGSKTVMGANGEDRQGEAKVEQK